MNITRDVRYALRQLKKSPGFTLTAIFTLAIGIGANTAMFSVINAVLLKPLSYRNWERIVTLGYQSKSGGKQHFLVSAPDFQDWHDQSRAFEAMALWRTVEGSVFDGSQAEFQSLAAISPEFFRVFGVQPAAGRLYFTVEEQKSSSQLSAVISYDFWQNNFGGSPAVVGRQLRLFQKAVTVVGVAPPGFYFPGKTGIWLPFSPRSGRAAHNYQVAGLLKPGATLQEAQTEMGTIGHRLAQQYPKTNKDRAVVVTPMRDSMVSNVKRTLWVLMGAVGALLLIACANVASLLLAKATARTREIAIRAAVGAPRSRIVGQLITESLLLAFVAGAAGLGIAVAATRMLLAFAPLNVPRLAETHIDGYVLAFTFGISLLTSLLAGIVPALHVSRIELNVALKQSATREVAGGAGRMRQAFVVAEIAASVVLLVGAGLLIRSFVALQNVSLGFRPEQVVMMHAVFPVSDPTVRAQTQIRTAIATLPGVTSAAASELPPAQVRTIAFISVDHAFELKEDHTSVPQALASFVSPHTFATLGIPVLQGRDFQESDDSKANPVAIINQSFAQKMFPGQNPLGHRIYCGAEDNSIGMEVIGVVGDVRERGPARPAEPEIYMTYLQWPSRARSVHFLARSSMDAGSLETAMRKIVHDRSPETAIQFTTLEESVSEHIAMPRFCTLLVGILAAIAVLVAAAGVYATMAYVVSQRSNEIGVRMALGATRGDVSRLVLRKGMQLALAGLLLGLAGAIVATRLLTSMLFAVKPSDATTYAGVVVVLAAAALAASYVPSRRAASLDPMSALRQE